MPPSAACDRPTTNLPCLQVEGHAAQGALSPTALADTLHSASCWQATRDTTHSTDAHDSSGYPSSSFGGSKRAGSEAAGPAAGGEGPELGSEGMGGYGSATGLGPGARLCGLAEAGWAVAALASLEADAVAKLVVGLAR